MNFKHKEAAVGRWFELTLLEQLGNIGGEISRASKWQDRDEKLFWGAVERALELFDLTLSDPRWTGRRLEIARAREVFCDAVYGGKLYKSNFQDLIKYFDQFAYAARLSVVTRHTTRSGFANIVAVIIALVVLAGAGAGYWAVKKLTSATRSAFWEKDDYIYNLQALSGNEELFTKTTDTFRFFQ